MLVYKCSITIFSASIKVTLNSLRMPTWLFNFLRVEEGHHYRNQVAYKNQNTRLKIQPSLLVNEAMHQETSSYCLNSKEIKNTKPYLLVFPEFVQKLEINKISRRWRRTDSLQSKQITHWSNNSSSWYYFFISKQNRTRNQ